MSENTRNLKPGDLLFREGDRGDHVYLIEDGKIEVVKNIDTPQENILHTVKAGEFIGEMAVLEDRPRAASARAVNAVTLISMDRTAFMSQAIRDPHSALFIMKTLSDRLRSAASNQKNDADEVLDRDTDQDIVFTDQNMLTEVTAETFSKKTMLASVLLSVIMISFIVITMLVEVETTVSAYARVVPKTPNLTVEASANGILKDIYIQEGDLVEAQQVLAIMDTSAIDADINATQAELDSTLKRHNRLTQERKLIRTNTMPTPDEMGMLDPTLTSRLMRRTGQITVFDQKMKTTLANLKSSKKEKETILAEVKNAKEQTKIFGEEHVETGVISRMDRLESQAELSTTEQKLLAKETVITEIEGNIEIIQAEKASFIAQWNAEIETQLEKDTESINILTTTLEGLKRERETYLVRSPVPGRVLDLLAYREGTVLTKGNPIAALTRSDQKLVVQAEIPPKDVGTLVEGLPVSFKLDALPFQRYGDITGIVMRVDEDSVASRRPGVKDEFYMVRIDLDTTIPSKAHAEFVLKRGMTGRADMITGKRSILSYILDPFLGALKTAFREPV